MDVFKLPIHEQVEIHAVLSDRERVGILFSLYPENKLSLEDLKEQTGLPMVALEYHGELLEEYGFVERSSEALVLTEKGKGLVETVRELLKKGRQ